MSTSIPAAFVKFFSEEAHADAFLRGSLYMNRLSYFRKLESEKDDGRPDAYEALSHWLQPDNLVITFTPPNLPEIRITGKDLAAPVTMAFDYTDHFHVFSICAMFLTNPEGPEFEGVDISEVRSVIHKRMQLDDRCQCFGEHAVLVQPKAFAEQLYKALQREGNKCQTGFVEYYDETTFNGQFDLNKMPFMKQKRFEYQQEFRVCLDTQTKGSDPLIINIGDISPFSTKIKAADLNTSFEVKLDRVSH